MSHNGLRLTGWLVAAALCAAIVAGGCQKPAQESGAAPGGKGPGGPPKEAAPVRVAPVARESVPVQLGGVGNVEAYSTIAVKSQVSGEITDVLFQEGDVVTEGQILFIIDRRPFEVALAQAEANLSRAEAQRDQSAANKARDVAQERKAQADLKRDSDLVGKGMVSQEEFDQVKANSEAATAAVAADDAAIKAAERAIQAARASIEEAKLELDYCTIRSPLQGRTGSLLIHKGNLIRANDTSPLVVITQTQPIYVSFTLPERHLAAIREHMDKGPLEVKAMIPEREELVSTGMLTFIDNTVDETTGMIRLKATFENKDDLLWPGQFVSVALQMAVNEDALVVPADAVQMGQNGMFVYVVKPDMSVEMRIVKTGETWNGRTVITEGVQADESVVTDGLLRTAPGATVRIITDEPAAKDKS